MKVCMEWACEGNLNGIVSGGVDGIFTCYKGSIHDGV